MKSTPMSLPTQGTVSDLFCFICFLSQLVWQQLAPCGSQTPPTDTVWQHLASSLASHFRAPPISVHCICDLQSKNLWLGGDGGDLQPFWASLVAQLVGNLPAVQETQVQSLCWEDLLEKGMATHSNILAWRIPWTKEPGGLVSIETWRVGHDWVTNIALLGGWPSRQVTFNGWLFHQRLLDGVPQSCFILLAPVSCSRKFPGEWKVERLCLSISFLGNWDQRTWA